MTHWFHLFVCAELFKPGDGLFVTYWRCFGWSLSARCPFSLSNLCRLMGTPHRDATVCVLLILLLGRIRASVHRLSPSDPPFVQTKQCRGWRVKPSRAAAHCCFWRFLFTAFKHIKRLLICFSRMMINRFFCQFSAHKSAARRVLQVCLWSVYLYSNLSNSIY